jgi:hypothetical protein
MGLREVAGRGDRHLLIRDRAPCLDKPLETGYEFDTGPTAHPVHEFLHTKAPPPE